MRTGGIPGGKPGIRSESPLWLTEELRSASPGVCPATPGQLQEELDRQAAAVEEDVRQLRVLLAADRKRAIIDLWRRHAADIAQRWKAVQGAIEVEDPGLSGLWNVRVRNTQTLLTEAHDVMFAVRPFGWELYDKRPVDLDHGPRHPFPDNDDLWPTAVRECLNQCADDHLHYCRREQEPANQPGWRDALVHLFHTTGTRDPRLRLVRFTRAKQDAHTGQQLTSDGLHLHVGCYRRQGGLSPPTRGAAHHLPAALEYILHDVLAESER